MDDESVLRRLQHADLRALGFQDVDANDVRGLIAALPGSAYAHRVTELARQLRRGIGALCAAQTVDAPAGPPTRRLHEERMLMLALIAVAPDVSEYYVGRGLPRHLAWRSLADLGQQVRVFRRMYGHLGLVTGRWVASNYTGRMVWLGRLQFTIERRDDGQCAVGIHIPEDGPLRAEDVDDALAQAGYWLPKVYPQYPPALWYCHSWMLDPAVTSQLPLDSNLHHFAQRFDRFAAVEEDLWAPLFFVFGHDLHLEPLDLSALPSDTRLRRIVREVLLSGGGGSCEGVLRTLPREPIMQ